MVTKKQSFMRCRLLKSQTRILTLAILLLSSMSIFAQQSKTVTGTVTEAGSNIPLPGVNVLVKGTTTGTATDFDGKFSISATPESTLVFSFLGYVTQELVIGSNSNFNVVLEENLSTLDEVVVVGYGTQKKSDITGAIAVVDASEAQKVSNSDVSQLLQGRAAGVTVTTDGQPGAAPNVRIRGVATFGNNQPLYIVDGVPVGTSIRDFNPNDIESIQVLKDASAGAIYGSRAANGVVILTTKQGKKESPLKIQYSGYYGLDYVGKTMPVLGREDYQMISNERRTNAGQPLVSGNNPDSDLFVSDIDTDWQDVGLKTGSRQNHNFNFSGGAENITYNASVDYFQNEGVFVGNGPTYERYSMKLNTTMEKGIFKMSPSVYYMHSFENSLTFRGDVLTGGRPPLINDLVTAIPTLGVYDENNEGGYAGTSSEIHQTIILNVPGINSLFTNTVEVDRTFAILNPEIKLINKENHKLNYKLNLSYDKTIARDFSFVPEFEMGYFFNSGKSLLDDNSRIYTVSLVENTLNYNGTFGKHNVDVLLGQTYQENSAVVRNAHSESLPKPYYPVLANGINQTVGGSETYSALYSLFGRLNYNYDDRYLVSATVRRDGSSRFAPENRFWIFPSVSAGWRVSNEEFFSGAKDVMNNLKFRASYGQLGNQNIGDYLYQATLNRNIPYNFNGVKVIGGMQTSVNSPNIKWETTTSFDVGADMSFFNGAVDFSADYYIKETEDVLVGVPIPTSVGSINAAPVVNAGNLRNSGFDFELTYHSNPLKEFTFDISANASTVKNEVLSLGGNDEPIYGAGAKTQVGQEIGQHFGFVYDGIFQSQEDINNSAFQNALTAPGDIKFKDLDGNGVIGQEDRDFLGSALPSVTYGLNFSAKYKNFDFTVFAAGAAGYYINSRLYRMLMLTTDNLNSHEDILNRWTPDNTNTSTPRVVEGDPNGNGRDSDRPGWLQRGDYLRVGTISIGYTLPENAMSKVFESARVYATGQNLHTFQAYKGYNPDFASGVFEPGFDNGTYPRPRTIMLGVELSF